MHVGVKKVVPEYLGIENLHAGVGQLPQIGAGLAQRLQVAHRDTAHAFHDEDPGAAIIPVHLGDVEQVGVGEIPAELGGIGGLAHQIPLIVHRLFVLAHHFYRA